MSARPSDIASSAILRPDICVIGAGSAGLSLAAGAAAFGVETVLVERGTMGGECLNTGCVPSKSLIAAAECAALGRRSEEFGVSFATPTIDHARVRDHVRNVIAGIAPHDSAERFSGLGVTVIKAEARFLDERTLEAGGTRIQARRFVVATGSRPAIPSIPGLDAVPYLTNETLFDQVPDFAHLLVLGGGPVGAEMAQAHRRLGSEVTLVTRGRLLSGEDTELAAVVADALRRDGVRVVEHASVERAEYGDGLVRLALRSGGEHFAVQASHLLVAAGRAPVTEGLDLDKAGVRFEPGGIAVSRSLHTTNRRIYAIGDCAAGFPRLTHVANDHAGLVLRAILFRLPVRFKTHRIPRAIFTAPELAQVGLTEAEARKEGWKPKILHASFAENDRARTARETEGLIKLVVGPRGKILGAGVVGPHAGELIHVWSLAVAKGLRVSDVAQTVMPYPTLGEIGKRASLLYFAGAARNEWVRRLLRFLRIWG